MCTSGSDCDLCKEGYRRAEVKDANGVVNVVCVTNFCGFYGEGTGCAGKVTLEGCDQSDTKIIEQVIVQTCTRCSPGYFLLALKVKENAAGEKQICEPQNGKVKISLYLAPFNTMDMTVKADKDHFSFNFEDDAAGENRAFSPAYPLYLLAQVFG